MILLTMYVQTLWDLRFFLDGKHCVAAPLLSCFGWWISVLHSNSCLVPILCIMWMVFVSLYTCSRHRPHFDTRDAKVLFNNTFIIIMYIYMGAFPFPLSHCSSIGNTFHREDFEFGIHDLRYWKLYTGEYNISTADPYQKVHRIRRVVIHPAYNYTTLDNDVALILTKKPIM